MNIGKTLGKLFGKSKKIKDGPSDEESGFHETVNIGDSFKGKIHEEKENNVSNKKEISPVGVGGDFLHGNRINDKLSANEVRGKSETSKGIISEETKCNDMHSIDSSSLRVGGNFQFENDSNELPSALEVKRRLLEADRAHKLWKIRRRFKMAGKEVSDEILSMEIDLSGPHKWDTFINRPPLERYILMTEYIRKLAAKEAKESGHFGIVTSETTEKQLSSLHKKLRLDFTLNANGQPSNISLGEDSSEEERFEEDINEQSFKWKNMSTFQSVDVSKLSINDNLSPLKQIYGKDLENETSVLSLNILQKLNKDESTTESSYPNSKSSVCSESDPKEAQESYCSLDSRPYYSSSSDKEQISQRSREDSDEDPIPRFIFNASNMSKRFDTREKFNSDEGQD